MVVSWMKLRSVPSSLALSAGRPRSTRALLRPLGFLQQIQPSSPARVRMLSTSVRAAPSSLSPSYSAATEERIRGRDAAREFEELAARLNKSHLELHAQLAQRHAGATEMTEKEEYVHWLLSGVAPDVPAPRTKTSTAASPADTMSSTAANGVRAFGSASVATGGADTKQQTYMSDVRFDDEDLGLHTRSRQAIAGMGLTHMTEIQAKTFAAAAAGHDVLGRARTGTGKTVAFLLPAIERLVRDGALEDRGGVGLLVLSPTRELANQIGEEATKLLRCHRGAIVQVVFGGTKIKTDINRLGGRKGLPTVLVATPGRLLDHLKTTRFETKSSSLSFGKDIMSQTRLVVLDETDRLLDMGFRRDIESILNYLPKCRDRQTLLFSATMPPALKGIMKTHMKPDYVEVDCIQDGDAGTHTSDRVQQSHVVLPAEGLDPVSAVIETVRRAVTSHADAVPPKIVAFFPTARLVQFYAQVFDTFPGCAQFSDGDGAPLRLPTWELHSKKSQGYRNRVSNEFRQARTGVLFTSDVSARGVDYPDVTHVLQFGLPDTREQYVHRLGRTGRAGAAGRGWLVLRDWEARFLRELEGMDVPANAALGRQLAASEASEETRAIVREAARLVRGGDGVLSKSGSAAYAAFLGYYKGQMKRLGMKRAEPLVDIANDFARAMGFLEPPQLQKSTVGKMGLKGVAGLNIAGGQNGGAGGQRGRGSKSGKGGNRRQ